MYNQLPENDFCMIHHQKDCDCKRDIFERMDEAETTLKVAHHQLMLLKRDKQELLNVLGRMITHYPFEYDVVPEYQTILKEGAALMAKHTQPKLTVV